MDTMVMTLPEFLQWLVAAGVPAGALAWVLEQIPWFQSLDANQKRLVTMGVSIVIAIAAYCVLTLVPSEILDQLTPVFQIIYGVVATYLANQFAHALNPARK